MKFGYCMLLLLICSSGRSQNSAMMTMTNNTKTGKTIDDYNYFKLKYGEEEDAVDTLFMNKVPIYCLIANEGSSLDNQTGCHEYWVDFSYVEDAKGGRLLRNARDDKLNFIRIYFSDAKRKTLLSVHFINAINEKIYWHD